MTDPLIRLAEVRKTALDSGENMTTYRVARYAAMAPKRVQLRRIDANLAMRKMIDMCASLVASAAILYQERDDENEGDACTLRFTPASATACAPRFSPPQGRVHGAQEGNGHE